MPVLEAPVLEVRELCKSFRAVVALDHVSLQINRGEIVGIVGENGAGKSTLLNILSGTERRDSGKILLNGDGEIAPRNYLEANRLGIWRVFQDPAVIPGIPVYENLFLGHADKFTRLGSVLDKRAMVREAKRIVHEMRLEIDVTQPTYRYNFAVRQALEVAKASMLSEVLGLESSVVLFDEPTTSLSHVEVEALLALMRELQRRGSSVVFVSHRLSEIFLVCSRLYVMKDGVLAAEVMADETEPTELHELMVGRVREKDYYLEGEQVEVTGKPVSVRVTDLNLTGELSDISFEVRQGEVLGLGGVIGSGKSELGRVLAGLSKPDSGTIEINGTGIVNRLTPPKAKAAGIGYVPPDRSFEGIIANFSVASNITLPSGESDRLGFTNRLGVWNLGRERQVARDAVEKFRIRGTPGALAATMSGGNQQKITVAKWVRREPVVLILDNPTRGVDVGARAEIYRIIRDLARSGTAIILISDDLVELVGLSNRILVLNSGTIATTVDAPPDQKPSEQEIVSHMIGALQFAEMGNS